MIVEEKMVIWYFLFSCSIDVDWVNHKIVSSFWQTKSNSFSYQSEFKKVRKKALKKYFLFPPFLRSFLGTILSYPIYSTPTRVSNIKYHKQKQSTRGTYDSEKVLYLEEQESSVILCFAYLLWIRHHASTSFSSSVTCREISFNLKY